MPARDFQIVPTFKMPTEGPWVIHTRGLPGSGKTRWASVNWRPDIAIVERDAIRMELQAKEGGDMFDRRRETRVAGIRDSRIQDALRGGMNVIVPDSGMFDSTIARVARVAAAACPYVSVYINDDFLQVPVDECIKRDLNANRTHHVGKDVIVRMYYDYWATQPKPVNEGAPCVLCDLDGTLALIPPGANKYNRDFTKDILNEAVRTAISHSQPSVFFLSGREEIHRSQTLEWLRYHLSLPEKYLSSRLFMRPTGDFRKDTIVKKELYMKHIQGRHRVQFVLDDRPSVVRMWRAELGLPVFQVAPDLEF